MQMSNLVFHGDRVPGHVDALDGPEGREGLPDGVLAKLIVDGAHVDATHDGQGPLPLCCHLPAGKGREREGAGVNLQWRSVGEMQKGKNHYKTHTRTHTHM